MPAGLRRDSRTVRPGIGVRMRRWLTGPAALRILVIAALLAAWEVGARLYGNPMFIRPPSEVVGAMPELFGEAQVVHAVFTTFWELAAAFAIAVTIGVSVGLWVGLHRFSRRSVLPIVLFLYTVPQVTVLPLFILFFGIGPASKIAFGVSHGMFPMIVTVVSAVQNVDAVLLRSAHSMGASRLQTFRWVVFPYMVPAFFTGMRLAMNGVLLGVLLAELYATQGGVGYYTRVFTEAFEPQLLFALIAVLAALAITLNELVRRAEVRFSRWKN
jgi:NitT/TauT family transport system permease protein